MSVSMAGTLTSPVSSFRRRRRRLVSLVFCACTCTRGSQFRGLDIMLYWINDVTPLLLAFPHSSPPPRATPLFFFSGMKSRLVFLPDYSLTFCLNLPKLFIETHRIKIEGGNEYRRMKKKLSLFAYLKISVLYNHCQNKQSWEINDRAVIEGSEVQQQWVATTRREHD